MKTNNNTQPLFFNQKEEVLHKRQEDNFYTAFKEQIKVNNNDNEVVKKSFKPKTRNNTPEFQYNQFGQQESKRSPYAQSQKVNLNQSDIMLKNELMNDLQPQNTSVLNKSLNKSQSVSYPFQSQQQNSIPDQIQFKPKVASQRPNNRSKSPQPNSNNASYQNNSFGDHSNNSMILNFEQDNSMIKNNIFQSNMKQNNNFDNRQGMIPQQPQPDENKQMSFKPKQGGQSSKFQSRVHNQRHWQNSKNDPTSIKKSDDLNNFNQIRQQISIGQGDIMVSNKVDKIIKKREDEFQNNYDKEKVKNSMVNTFQGSKVKNNIDDLHELLENSEKLEEAKLQVKMGTKFVDDYFPPAFDSIYGFEGIPGYLDKTACKKIFWYRPEKLWPGQNISVYQNITPTDILQGQLGDCYFLSAIAAIAEFPVRLERLFLSKDIQQDGIYCLAMCVDGMWQEVILDDLFPSKKYRDGHIEPIFNRSKEAELWVMLLEKAWAKVNGGYCNIDAGLTREALRDLTGASAKTFFTRAMKPEQIWQILQEADEQKWIMTAGSDNLNKDGTDAFVEKIGIAGSHAYSLISVHELIQTNQGYQLHTSSRQRGQIVRLVQLRNPWGEKEWQGDWSDNDRRWTEQLRRDLNQTKSEDGIFYMPFEYFLKYFSDFQICYYHDDYKYSAIRIEQQPTETKVLTFKVNQAGRYYLSLNQINRRKFKNEQKYQYSNCIYTLQKIVGKNKLQFIDSQAKRDKENFICPNLDRGEYVIAIKTPWISCVNQCNFSIYGPQITDIQESDETILSFNYYQNIFFQQNLQNEIKQRDYQLLDKKGLVKYADYQYEDYYFLYLENNSRDQILMITFDLIDSQNIEVLRPYNGLKVTVELEPGERDVVPIVSLQPPSLLSYKLMYQFSDRSQIEQTRKAIRELGSCQQRQLNGQDIDIKVYNVQNDQGLFLLYINNSSYLTLSEQIEFEMRGCFIAGVDGEYVSLVVIPNSQLLLMILNEKPGNSYSCAIEKLNYTIF